MGEDLFNWEDIDSRPDKSHCEKYIKFLFQSFEGLAFSLINERNFFTTKPKNQIYDLFTFYRNVEETRRGF